MIDRFKKWLTDRHKYRDRRSVEHEEDARAYEEILENFRKENPNGLNLYDGASYRGTTKDGVYDGV